MPSNGSREITPQSLAQAQDRAARAF